MALDLAGVKQRIQQLEQEKAELVDKLAKSAAQSEALQRDVEALEAELSRLRDILTQVQKMVGGGLGVNPPPPPIANHDLVIDFEPSNLSATMTFTDPRTGVIREETVTQPSHYSLLRLIVLCASDLIEVEVVGGKKRFHYAWVAYLNRGAPMNNTKQVAANFAATVSDLNKMAAKVITGDEHNKNAYLLVSEGRGRKGTRCYVVRLNTPEMSIQCKTNISDVDLYLRKRDSHDDARVREEQLRCEAAIAAICPGGKVISPFAEDQLACEAAKQIQTMKEMLIPTDRDAWVEKIYQLVLEVRQHKDLWTLGTTGLAVPTDNAGNVAATSSIEGAFEIDLQRPQALLDLASMLTPLLRKMLEAVGANEQAAYDYLLNALFLAAHASKPEIWTTRQHVEDYFTHSLPVYFVSSIMAEDMNAKQKELCLRTIDYFSHIVFHPVEASPPRQDAARWMIDLAGPKSHILHATDVLKAIRVDWIKRPTRKF